MTAAVGEGADHDHHIAVCLNQQEGAVKHGDQQKVLIIMTMLHLVALAGIENLPPVPALTTTTLKRFALYEDPRFLSKIVYAFVTGSVEWMEDVQSSGEGNTVVRGKLFGSFAAPKS